MGCAKNMMPAMMKLAMKKIARRCVIVQMQMLAFRERVDKICDDSCPGPSGCAEGFNTDTNEVLSTFKVKSSEMFNSVHIRGHVPLMGKQIMS